MIVRIKYKDLANPGNYIIEELDDQVVNIPEYTRNVHINKLCGGDKSSCVEEDCIIWLEQDGFFMVVGVED